MQEHQEYNYDLGYKYLLANCKTEKKGCIVPLYFA